ncbi:DsrE family protein [uncultured Lentibacter sp.]|jgi:intracellular sulfur oxidation DsrE/DsrF family protein|uniref:DsrE family protein n=1 Tax=uncultured Lentibacter sp. TaxID=1659309 RepID=UPI002608A347|nr:DsrE family protein [uncultured Lentibacter sp.]
MKTFLTLAVSLALTLASFALSSTPAEASERYSKQKVVYHINYDGGKDDKKYRGAMRNIQNHINAVGAENMDIKVVLHGNGLGLLSQAKANEALRGQVLELKGQNVSMHVCNNTLKGRKISYENDLFDVFEEDIVPSGVAELSHLQQQGYTYIKP